MVLDMIASKQIPPELALALKPYYHEFQLQIMLYDHRSLDAAGPGAHAFQPEGVLCTLHPREMDAPILFRDMGKRTERSLLDLSSKMLKHTFPVLNLEPCTKILARNVSKHADKALWQLPRAVRTRLRARVPAVGPGGDVSANEADTAASAVQGIDMVRGFVYSLRFAI